MEICMINKEMCLQKQSLKESGGKVRYKVLRRAFHKEGS